MPVYCTSTHITYLSSEAKEPPGTQAVVWHPTHGEQVWMYVENLSGGALAVGEVLSRETTRPFSVEKCPANAITSRVIGVAQHAIPSGYFGWVMRSGRGARVLADGTGLSADSGLITGDSAGTADTDSTQATSHFGLCLETVSGGETALCVIDCRG